jgi:hypothetical protein
MKQHDNSSPSKANSITKSKQLLRGKISSIKLKKIGMINELKEQTQKLVFYLNRM